MSIEQNSGKPARLSLSERAKQGLLLLEPELALGDLLQLEHPGDPAARMELSMAIKAAIDYGDLATRTVCQPWQRTVLKSVGGWLDGNPNWDEKRLVNESGATKTVLIDRETYRAWRNACPAELLSPLTQIHKWLSATPEPARPATPEPVENSLPEQRQRPDALNHAIRAALAVLSPSGALPRPHELFDYLAKNDSTRTITGVSNDGKALLWTGDNGSFQKSDIRALTERLRRWKG